MDISACSHSLACNADFITQLRDYLGFHDPLPGAAAERDCVKIFTPINENSFA